MRTTGPEKAKTDDFLAIAELDRKAWKERYYADFMPDGEHVWRLWVEHALVYVTKEDEKVLGAVVAFPCMSGIYCAHKVFVDPDIRHRGIATALCLALLDDLDKLQVDCFTTVDPSNEGLINLYTGFGFTEKQFVKGYYRPNEDRFVLTRRARRKQ